MSRWHSSGGCTLLIHFPIALMIVAVAAETAATLTDDDRWRAVAVAHISEDC